MKIKVFLSGFLWVIFVWAAGGDVSAQRSVEYTCGKGTLVTASFDKDGDTVSVHFKKSNLPSRKSASGSKYSDGKTTFWTKGKEAMLTMPGFNGKCKEVIRESEAISGNLEGTSWRLVKFVGGDDTVLKPTSDSQYTISFASAGKLSAKMDCNRGVGSWSSDGPNQIRMGNLATTMMMCPNSGDIERIGRDWMNITSYVIKDGHLFLSLMADGGIYEFAPLADAKVTGTVTYRERMALPAGAVVEVSLLDVSKADVAADVISEQKIDTAGKQVPFNFELPYDPSKIDARMRYAVRAKILVGDDLIFTSTDFHGVITDGNPTKVDIVVKRAK